MAVKEARVPILREERPVHRDSHGEKAQGVGGEKKLSNSSSILTSLVSGAAAGALAKTTIAPLDRTKINFQISQTRYSWRAAVRFLQEAVSREGAGSLWRGNSATMARIVPYAAIQFAAHDHWKRCLGVDNPAVAQQHRLRLLLAGSLAGVTSQSITYPLDVARARMAVTAASDYRSLRDVFSRVVAQEGFRTLYRGYTPTILGVIPYAGVSFFTYDTLKHFYYVHMEGSRSPAANVALGGVSGALAQSASYPLDILRRRMQTARRRSDGSYPCGTITDTAAQVYQTEGWRGFFKGLSMNWVKGPIAVGISFATYDAIKASLTDIALSLS